MDSTAVIADDVGMLARSMQLLHDDSLADHGRWDPGVGPAGGVVGDDARTLDEGVGFIVCIWCEGEGCVGHEGVMSNLLR